MQDNLEIHKKFQNQSRKAKPIKKLPLFSKKLFPK